MAIKCARGDEIPRKRLCPIFCENRIASGSDDSRTKNSTTKEKSGTSNEIGNILRSTRRRTLKIVRDVKRRYSIVRASCFNCVYSSGKRIANQI